MFARSKLENVIQYSSKLLLVEFKKKLRVKLQ